MRHILLFLIACVPWWLAAQTDSLFAPKPRHASRLWDNSGVYWRVGTGVRWVHDDDFYAATVPIQLEAGYKFHFLEAGFQYTPGALPLGRDDGNRPIHLNEPFPDTWPQMASFSSAGWSLGLHLTVARVPLFARLGSQRLHIAPRLRSRSFNEDGTPKVTYPLNPLQDFNLKSRYRLRSLMLGVEQGQWWGGIQFNQRSATDVEKFNFFNLFLGIQMSPGRGQAFEKNAVDYMVQPRRWALALSRSFLHIPQQRSALAMAWKYSVSRRLTEHWGIHLNLIRVVSRLGIDYHRPQVTDEPQPVGVFHTQHWQNAWEGNYGIFSFPQPILWNAQAVYYPQSISPLAHFFTGGLGVYRLITPEPYAFKRNPQTSHVELVFPNQKPQEIVRPALSAGMGFQFRWVYCSMTLHKPLSRFPVFVEWSAGIRWAFGRRI